MTTDLLMTDSLWCNACDSRFEKEDFETTMDDFVSCPYCKSSNVESIHHDSHQIG